MKNENDVIDSYDLKEWIGRLGSVPVKKIDHADLSEPYQQTSAMVLKLENGKYALITEHGCSCYSSSDAAIGLYPTKSSAMEAFEKWKKENKRT